MNHTPQTSKSDSDRILDGYSEWLNDALYDHKAEEDVILWLGDHRWMIASNLDPGEVFVISIKKATLA